MKDKTHPRSEWAFDLRTQEIFRKGPLKLEMVATDEERAAIARRLNLLRLERLEATLHVARWRDDGVDISGELRATVAQACVVTLEPVEEILNEPVEVRFEARRDAGRVAPSEDSDTYDLLDPEAPDPPDALPQDGRIPVGELLIQLLSVALDPYPRREGAALPDAVAGEKKSEIPSDHPFAGLAALKKGD